ncbi:MAG: MlaD family protein [Gallionella sp.]|nr:MlaD family protein [Gallionella sp.]MDP1941079.1 MlaD family protein [Gallionella sp.]
MEEKVNFAVVGVFVLVLSAALIGGVLWFGSGLSYRTVYDVYLTYMNESVSGLNLNAPVRYRGVEVGRVQQITLAPDNVEQVQLTLGIERGTPIKIDTVAVLQTHGLTGLTFVELTGGSRDAPALGTQQGEKFPVIKTRPSLMTRLDTSVSSMFANLNRTSENINALLDEDNRRAIKHTLADIEILSRTLAARQTTIDSSLSNAALTLENTARLTGELPQLAERIQRSADAFDHMSNELALAGASTRATMNSTQQFTSETLPEIRLLVVELRDLTHSLRRFSGELEQNPGVLLHGKAAAKRGPGE